MFLRLYVPGHHAARSALARAFRAKGDVQGAGDDDDVNDDHLAFIHLKTKMNYRKFLVFPKLRTRCQRMPKV